MCTSVIYSPNDHYFGRNLDLEVSFGEKVIITPRNYEFNYRNLPSEKTHYAMIGMSIMPDDYPLYFDAANEKGLGLAGLNFDGPCHFFPKQDGKENIASFELFPYLLGSCETVAQAKEKLEKTNITDQDFSDKFKASPLHWLMADKTGASAVIESTKTGLHVYDNPVGVLTNNPEFPSQILNAVDYMSVSPAQPKNTIAPDANLKPYSRGFGSHLLPGGMGSADRFVKETFVLNHAPKGNSEIENVTNYFHNLHAVEQQKGLDEISPNIFEYTIYSDGTNLDKGIFYYTTYENNQINAVDMNKVDLDGDKLITYDMLQKQAINYQN